MILGLENRPKDTGLFFFWMTLRQQNLDFLKANLFLDESACEAGDGKEGGKNEESNSEKSTFAKRKRRDEEIASKKHETMKQ